ncbi:hypothetical protein IQ259_07410 [Fortiea sp. LEGE XX443]|uniref:hypothetical protein n=1 Tax=Fortiea sp. LEGE XX443 TaxID=1828611 RepID=UPI0018829786|nr:hypothetical protein [Fortiea sp. LEGE XX443]MBE9004866.1 hypothetical protein [Fortiea sp. LEGE XX443]
MNTLEKGIITFAYGKPKFINMAKTLARSLRLHSPTIPCAIVTDCQEDPELEKLFDHLIPFQPEYGGNMKQKLYLDIYSPFQKTLYVDSDSIVVRDINFIFEAFQDRSFSLPGERYLTFGEQDPYIKDLDFILNHFGLTKLPKFNGGLYYFDKSETAQSMFDTTRSILANWEKLGFNVWRGDGPCDEPIVAIAMTLHNQTMFSDSGSMMRTPVGIRGSLDVDVINSKCTFQKYEKIVSPAIVHFAGDWLQHPVYAREALKLQSLGQNPTEKSNFPLLKEIHSKFKYRLDSVIYMIQKIKHHIKSIARIVLKSHSAG